MKNRVAIFARVSTDQQSYARQIADLTHYAESHNLKVVATFAETVSGTKFNTVRTAIINLREEAKAGKFDKILITELSRLGRNAFQVATLINEFTELGISIVVQSLGVETLSESGRANPLVDMFLAIVNQFSTMERAFLVDRINSGLAKAKANGKVLGRRQGSTLENSDLLKKYPKLVRDLRANISVRKSARIHSVSTATVQKVRKAIPELVMISA